MRTLPAPPGLRGFDVDERLTYDNARVLRAAGFSFACRYIRRVSRRATDLTVNEASDLARAGLGLMLVQHVESALSWVPSIDKGKLYGQGAVIAATELGYPQGATVWLDLEGVAPGTNWSIVVSYCNVWHDTVAAGGWLPGIYVGWHAGLDRDQLYRNLRFTRYWSAYNLNSDQEPAVRGVCMRQRRQQKLAGLDFFVDPNMVVRDAKGDIPVLAIPDEWESTR